MAKIAKTCSVQGAESRERTTRTHLRTKRTQLGKIKIDIQTGAIDVKGDPHTTTNPLGHLTTVVAPGTRGLPTQVRDANNVVTVPTWDPRPCSTQQNIQHGSGDAITKHAYDAVGQLTRITLPNAASWV